jgi:hypothetical protein
MGKGFTTTTTTTARSQKREISFLLNPLCNARLL